MGLVLKTPAKVLIGLIVLGATASAVYGIWNTLAESESEETSSSQVASSTKPASKPKASKSVFSMLGGSKEKGPLGSESNPLQVSLVSFHGYAPAFLANGGSLTTQKGSIFEQNGVHVEFLLHDDIPTLTSLFESGSAHCAWRTSDFFAQEHSALRESDLDAKAILVVDNTRGGDAIITSNPAIQSVEGLAGHSVGLLQFTPSDGLLTHALKNSALSKRKKSTVTPIYMESTSEVLAAYQNGDIDAAVLWDPDLSLALKKEGSHTIYSTATATNLIYDVIVCNTELLNEKEHKDVFQSFVSGWLEGTDQARQRPDLAAKALSAAVPYYQQLSDREGLPFVQGLFKNLLWTNLVDNARILGRGGLPNHYAEVYDEFEVIYRDMGYITGVSKIVGKDTFDYRFVDSLIRKDSTIRQKAAAPEFEFSKTEARKVLAQADTRAMTNKPVNIDFATGKSALTEKAKVVLEEQVVPLLDEMGNAYFEVSGNTDSTGSNKLNKALGLKRAQSVVSHLVDEWEVDSTRLIPVGNGEESPICNENAPKEEGLTLQECRARNRATRIRVLSR